MLTNHRLYDKLNTIDAVKVFMARPRSICIQFYDFIEKNQSRI